MLDTSAIIAALLGERGGGEVRAIGRLVVCSVNFAEVVHVLARKGHGQTPINAAPLRVEPFDRADAEETARLLNQTRAHGLSLGDCACLALARRLKLPVVTADRAWAQLDLGVEVVLIR